MGLFGKKKAAPKKAAAKKPAAKKASSAKSDAAAIAKKMKEKAAGGDCAFC